MKKLITQLKFHPLSWTVVLGVLLVLGNSLQLTGAQDSTSSNIPYPFQNLPQTQEDGTPVTNLCEPEMQVFANKEIDDFTKFLETNYQNKSSTTSLTATAIAKYRELRSELYTAYGRYYPNMGSLQLTVATQPNKCMAIINDTLASARSLLQKHALRTSGVKKTTALLEKYKAINAGLANLYGQFVFIKSYMDSFSAKLPCYPKTGCLKG